MHTATLAPLLATSAMVLAALALPAAEPGPGLPNVAYDPATQPAGTLLSLPHHETGTSAGDFPPGIFAGTIGRGPTAMSIHRGYLVMAGEGPGQKRGSDVRHMAWDISDPTAPVEELSWGGQAGYNAHGSIKAGQVWRSGARLGIADDGTLDTSARFEAQAHWSRGGLWTGWRVTFNWSYGTPTDPYVLERYDYDGREWVEQARWNHLAETGVPGHPFILGNILIIASDQADQGVVTYDISDPTRPVLLDQINGGVNGIGGYWTEVWKNFLVFPRRKNGGVVQFVDYQDPTDLRFVQELVAGGNPMYAQFQDDYAFIENNKIDLSPLERGEPAEIVLEIDEAGSGIDTSQFGLPAGNLWITGGIQGGSKLSQGAAIWIHDTEADETGPSVGYHLPRDGEEHYSPHCPITMLVHETCETANLIDGETIILRPVGGGDPVATDIAFSFNDILSMTPKTDLAAGVDYEVLLTTDALTDAVGNPLQDVTGAGDTVGGKDIAYRFTFTTDAGDNPRPVIDEFTASESSPLVVGSTVTFTVVASDDDELEYRLDFGDGDAFSRSRSEWGSATSWEHSYDTAGNYRARVQVREVGTLTRLSSAVIPLVVHEALPEGRPTTSGTIAIDVDGRQVWAVNPDNDSVVRIDADSAARLGAPVPVGDHPFNVAVDASGRAWVSCRDDDSLHVLAADGTTVQVIELPYGSRPTAVVFAPDGVSGYCALGGTGGLLRLDGDAVAVGTTVRERHGLNFTLYQWRGDEAPWTSLDGISAAASYSPINNNLKYVTGIWDGTPSDAIKQEFSDNFARDDDKLNFRSRKLGGNFAVIYRAWLQVDDAGSYTFHVTANDAARLTIGGQVVTEDETITTDRQATTTSGSIDLEAGRHRVEIRFFENDRHEELLVEWEGPGIERVEVPAERWFPEQDHRRYGALTIAADGSQLMGAQLIADDHAARIGHYDIVTDTWLPTIWLIRDTFTSDTGAQSRGVPNYLRGLSYDFAGTGAWYAGKKDNIVVGHFHDGDDPTFETSVRAVVGPLDLTQENPREIETPNALGKLQRIDIDNHAMPAHLVYGPLGTKIFLPMQANNRLIVLDGQTGGELARVDTGLAPDGVAVDPATRRIFIKNLMSRSVTVVDGSALIDTGARDLGPERILAQIASVDDEALSASVLRGKQLFYSALEIDPELMPPMDEGAFTTRMTTDGYISCAVCHLDGGHDGRTWDFTHRGEGLRNTTTLRGRRGTGHGPVHWTGNFDEIQDFELDIVNHFGGSGFLAADGGPHASLAEPNAGRDADLDALADYVASLDSYPRSPHRQTEGSLTEEAVHGRVLFRNLDCASCHSGADFTDSALDNLHDIGTLKESSGTRLGEPLTGIDTPSLKGVWHTGPYLHDGSASTLAAVFDQAAEGTAHRRVQQLTAGQRNELIAYLEQLDGAEVAVSPVVRTIRVRVIDDDDQTIDVDVRVVPDEGSKSRDGQEHVFDQLLRGLRHRFSFESSQPTAVGWY